MRIENYIKTHCDGKVANLAKKFKKLPQNIDKILRKGGKPGEQKYRWFVLISDDGDQLARKTKKGAFVVVDDYFYEIMGTYKK